MLGFVPAMRITIVQGPFLPVPPLLGGAVERSMESLGRHWAAAGCEVTHLSRRFPGLPDEERRAGVLHRRVASRDAPAGRLGFRWHELLYCRRVRAALPPADIVVTNSVLMPLLLRDRGFGRLVVRVERPPKGQLRFYRHAALLQTVSQDMRERILRQAPEFAERVSVVGLPLDGALAPCPADSLEPPRDSSIVFVGRLHPEKGVDRLIEGFLAALPALGDAWRLLLVGPHEGRAGGGGAAWLQHLRSLAAPAGGRIVFAGPVFDPGELAAILRRSSVFAYPSLADQGEALGLAPLEAMGQGVVPVVSALPCFREYLADGVNGLVARQDDGGGAQRLAQAFARLATTPDLVASLRRAALVTAQRYAATTVAERHLADYRALLAS